MSMKFICTKDHDPDKHQIFPKYATHKKNLPSKSQKILSCTENISTSRLTSNHPANWISICNLATSPLGGSIKSTVSKASACLCCVNKPAKNSKTWNKRLNRARTEAFTKELKKKSPCPKLIENTGYFFPVGIAGDVFLTDEHPPARVHAASTPSGKHLIKSPVLSWSPKLD